MSKTNLRTLAEIAIFSALALILDKIPLYTMPQGGSVSLVMLPILLLALRHGFSTGILSGLIVGTVQLFFGGYFLNIIQVFLDYALSYAGIGFAGLLAKQLKQQKSFQKQILTLTLAGFLGASIRFLGNFLAGIIFYGDYAPKGTPVWIYSLTYNLSYILPSTVICLALLITLLKLRPNFFKV
ncbi:energy-coupled thiamine transporter ThiT [Streptococcus gallolyticus]|nr:energy-coupled thiamine transporter ThiT [Streptococcus gallolyticus]MBY5042116.1 energy-coupled thiamine transporter ThiT [Streptococcus gallolyticus]